MSMKAGGAIRVYDGAVAIVTGGGSGIGRGLSEALARRGCEVVVADVQKDAADGVASHILSSGWKAMAAHVDVTDAAAMEQLVQDTVGRAGRLDYMFNNAGIGFAGQIKEYTDEEWRRIIEVNILGVVHGVRAASRVMEQQGYGHIINTSSMAGLMPSPASIAYATTKHAVVGMSVSLRARAALSGIRVSVLCPGFVRTPILRPPDLEDEIDLESAGIARAIPKTLRPMSPDVFGEKALDAIARNKAIIILPARWKIFWRSYRLCPTCAIRQATRRLRRAGANLGIVEPKPSG